MPNITIGLVSYKRPLFLAECIKAMYRNPGKEFELLIWSNDIENKGSYALEDIFKKVRTKYFVVVEEDEIWFQDNWLKDLVKAFEQKPGITKEGKKMGFKNEWGILATNMIDDDVNTSERRYQGLIRFKQGKFSYLTNIRAGGGAMIFKTETLRKMNPFKKDRSLNGALYPLILAYEEAKYPQGIVENIKIYHAYSPYWNELYPEVFKEKQKGKTIEDAKKQFNLNYANKYPMRMFLDDKFDEYIRNRQ